MQFHQMRYFLTACDTLNFTHAAEALDVAVPTLTRGIKKLEEELGGQLFRRERHLTRLTDLGRLMAQQLRKAYEAAEAAKDLADRHRWSETRLKIGVITTMSARHLVQYLRHLGETAPGLEICIQESHCADIAQSLEKAEIDIALLSLPLYPDTFRAQALYDEPYDIAFAPGHRFEAMVEVPLAELEGETYVKREHCEFPSNFEALGIDKPYRNVRVRYSTAREDWLQSMVAAGLGCTLMPRNLPIMPGLLGRPIVEPEVSRTISIVTRAGRPHSNPVKQALQCARNMTWTECRADLCALSA